MCDLAYAHRLEKADRDQQNYMPLVVAGAEPRDFRAEVGEWLADDIEPAERDELREVLGV